VTAAFPLGSLGRLEEECEVHRKVLAAEIRIYGEGHPHVRTTATNVSQTAARLDAGLIQDTARPDRRRALELADEAVRVAPTDPSRLRRSNLCFALMIQGWARYDVGDWAASKASLESSIARANELEPNEGVANVWTVLALANHRLGDFKEARRWYQKGIGGPGCDVIRFQRELEALFRAPAEAPRPATATR
jgi:tetratricopeptide (TPR) repeat protein